MIYPNGSSIADSKEKENFRFMHGGLSQDEFEAEMYEQSQILNSDGSYNYEPYPHSEALTNFEYTPVLDCKKIFTGIGKLFAICILFIFIACVMIGVCLL